MADKSSDGNGLSGVKYPLNLHRPVRDYDDALERIEDYLASDVVIHFGMGVLLGLLVNSKGSSHVGLGFAIFGLLSFIAACGYALRSAIRRSGLQPLFLKLFIVKESIWSVLTGVFLFVGAAVGANSNVLIFSAICFVSSLYHFQMAVKFVRQCFSILQK